MTTLDRTLKLTSEAIHERPAGGRRFDLPVALLSLWLILGTYLDGFVHHNFAGTIESFFTIWHAVLYSGFLAVAAFILFHQLRNMLRGHAWNRALPAGYDLSLWGVPLFMVAGVGDLIWHSLFGFEVGIEALLSPTHLLLGAGAMLIISGPLRAAVSDVRAKSRPSWADLLPAALSLLMVLSVFTFFTDYVNLLVNPDQVIDTPVAVTKSPTVPNPVATEFLYHREAQGLAGVLFPSALFVGVLLLGLRRGPLPAGSVALVLTGNGLLMAFYHYKEMQAQPQALVPLLAGGLMAELLYRWLRPSFARPRALRLFAFLVPLAQFGLFFVLIVATAGVWWSIHMWTGAIFLAGVAGLALSVVALPAQPEPATA